VDLVLYVGLHHALSSRSLDQKEAYPVAAHDVTPSERGHFSTPIKGHYCTPADTNSMLGPGASDDIFFERFDLWAEDEMLGVTDGINGRADLTRII
jgi:hypothetical protein